MVLHIYIFAHIRPVHGLMQDLILLLFTAENLLFTPEIMVVTIR